MTLKTGDVHRAHNHEGLGFLQDGEQSKSRSTASAG